MMNSWVWFNFGFDVDIRVIGRTTDLYKLIALTVS